MTDIKLFSSFKAPPFSFNREGIEFFEGSWQAIRTIRNEIGPDLIVKGEANFTLDKTKPTQLHYRERMIIEIQQPFQLDNTIKPLVATQEYYYNFINNNSKNIVHVFFQNSSLPFHQFTLMPSFYNQNSPLIVIATPHLCGQDHYSTSYSFLDIYSFQIKYTVIGPNKNYVAETLFKRII